MSDETSEVINIASRIKQFSKATNVDKNGNVENLKPNPQPRRRHRTEEFHNLLEPKVTNSVLRSNSNPLKKPILPVKPAPRSPKFDAKKPQAIPRVKSPEHPVKPVLNRLSGNLEKSIVKPERTSAQETNNKTTVQKPALSQKPAILTAKPGIGVAKLKTIVPNQETWKKTAGPPKSPLPSGPSKSSTITSQQTFNPKPKPPRGKERSVNEYENNNIGSSKIKSVTPNINRRLDTLDGQRIISAHSSDDDEDYEDPYEHDFFSKRPQVLSKQNENKEEDDDDDYDQADMVVPLVKGSVQCESTDDEVYEDPDSVIFNPQINITNTNSNSDDSDYELPPDAKGPIIQSVVDDLSDDDYDMPHTGPPPVPHHQNSSSFKGPPIPSHQNIAENNLSSSDEDACPDYMDPDSSLTKPPVPLYVKTRLSVRRGSNVHFQPAEYMPVSEMVQEIDDDDEIMKNTTYIDPATTFATSPLCKIGVTVDTDFEEEEEIYGHAPLYQVYSKEVNEEFHRQSKKQDDDDDDGDINNSDDNMSLHADLLGTGTKSIRMLWSELPSVRTSGTLESIAPTERKRQEAMFEVITSEASYLKSLDILVRHFMLNKSFLPNPNMPSTDPDEAQLLDRQQYHFLFTGLSAIKSVSERFLKDLRRRQQQSVIISSISDIICDYAQNHFNCYAKYCANQVFQDRTLSALLHSNPEFVEILAQLENNTICQGLSMQSFLTLPMQRITRLPLLVDAICSRCEPGSEEFNNTDKALKAVNVLVHESNENARKMVRTEEMYFIQKMLTFKTKPIPLVSSSRWLVKKGDVMCLHEEGRFSKYKNQLRNIFKGKCKPIYLFLFTDLVLVTKMKSDESFKVIDHCQRSLLKVEVVPNIPDPEPPKVGTLGTLHINPLKYAFTLILLENANNKTVDYHCFLDTQTDITRWLEAFNPPKSSSEIEGEAIYEEWDCPQVQVIHPYQAGQNDELALFEGDVIKVLRKLPDGWAEGMRLRDDEKGWFPFNHTDEIDSKHIRAKNLMQRYRLLTASKSIIHQIIGK